MTKSQAQLLGEQLKIALQVLLQNTYPSSAKPSLDFTLSYPSQFPRRKQGDGRETRVKLHFVFHFEIRLMSPCSEIGADVGQLAYEVEKIVPNVHVTELFVNFSSSSIMLIVNELGKMGTYMFDFRYVKA